MNIKYGHGLEFDPVDDLHEEEVSAISPESDAALEQIMRHGFRAPVGLPEQISLTINGNHYVVFNLGVHGVGIYLNRPGEIKRLVQLPGMSLIIEGQSFTVDGIVKHLSNDGIHELCGIELTAISDDCQKAIIRHLDNARSTLFVP